MTSKNIKRNQYEFEPLKLIKKENGYYLYKDDLNIAMAPFKGSFQDKSIGIYCGQVINISLSNCMEIEALQPDRTEWNVFFVNTRDAFPIDKEESTVSFGFFKSGIYNLIDLEEKIYAAPKYYFEMNGFGMRNDTNYKRRIHLIKNWFSK